MADLYRQRGARFALERDRLRAWARDLAMPIALDEPFPLLRFMYGSFDQRNSRFTINKVHVDTGTAPVEPTMEVWSLTASITYLAITPFCADEGYPVDADDSDPVRREAKLNGPMDYRGSLPLTDVPAFLPVSPNRLWINCDVQGSAEDSVELATQLCLELGFPNGVGYLAALTRQRRPEAGRLTFQDHPRRHQHEYFEP